MRFHDARHTAASIALESGIDIKVVSDQLGHSTTRITHDLYQHVVRRLHDEAADLVARQSTGNDRPVRRRVAANWSRNGRHFVASDLRK
jgi:integrase